MMKPSNSPEIGIAQEWIEEIAAWIDGHGLRGFEPGDVWRYPWMHTLQPYPAIQGPVEMLCDAFPQFARHILGIEAGEDPESRALVALGDLRRFELTGDAHFFERAEEHLDWLQQHAAQGFHGLCWNGAQGSPAWPVAAMAGEACLLAHALAKKDTHLDGARRIAEFVLRDLPRMEESDGTACFGIAPNDTSRVHHANLRAAAHLLQVAQRTGETALSEAAELALQYSLKRQLPDGAWHYGEYTGDEPAGPETPARIAHHPTASVLRTLRTIQIHRPGQDVESALRCGFSYYYQHLLEQRRMPIQADAAYPVDIRDCAAALLCCAALAPLFPPAERCAIGVLRWTWSHLRTPKGPALHYRKYRWFTSRIALPGWGVAWMYHALAEYLHYFLGKTARAPGPAEREGA